MRLGKVDVAADFRIAVDHDIVSGRGRTRIGVERANGAGEWTAVRWVDVGNGALFVIHDAVGRACTMAMKELR